MTLGFHQSKESLVAPICKIGEESTCKNHREISMVDFFPRLFADKI